MANKSASIHKNEGTMILDRIALTENTTIDGGDVVWNVTAITEDIRLVPTITVRNYDKNHFAEFPFHYARPCVIIKVSCDLGQSSLLINDVDGNELATLSGDYSTTPTYVVLRLQSDECHWEKA